MNNDTGLSTAPQKTPGSLWTYTLGFVLSVGLTLAAYLLVTRQVSSGWDLVYAIIVLAVVQFFVQMFFFLHIGRGVNRRWNWLAMGLMLVVVFIVVVGSIWIMHNLNYRMSPQQMSQYMRDQESGGL